MSDVLTLAVKGCLGGLLVVAFAVLAEMLKPKSFAGLFGAAPSIALAALTVTIVTKGSTVARAQSLGMIGGAIAMVCYCAGAVYAVHRWGALPGSVAAFVVWFTTAGAYCAVMWAR